MIYLRCFQLLPCFVFLPDLQDSQLRWSPEDWAVVVVGSVVVNWILSRQFPLLCSYRPNLTWSISLFDYTSVFQPEIKKQLSFIRYKLLLVWHSTFFTLNVKQQIILGASQQILQILTRGISSKPKSTFNIEINFMLKFKDLVQGCVFFLLLFTETESPSLQKSFRSAIVWILAEVWPYKIIPTRSPGTNIFSQLLQNIFLFEGSLLANC